MPARQPAKAKEGRQPVLTKAQRKENGQLLKVAMFKDNKGKGKGKGKVEEGEKGNDSDTIFDSILEAVELKENNDSRNSANGRKRKKSETSDEEKETLVHKESGHSANAKKRKNSETSEEEKKSVHSSKEKKRKISATSGEGVENNQSPKDSDNELNVTKSGVNPKQRRVSFADQKNENVIKELPIKESEKDKKSPQKLKTNVGKVGAVKKARIYIYFRMMNYNSKARGGGKYVQSVMFIEGSTM